MSRPTVGLATCDRLPELDEEGHLLIAALDRAGLAGRPAVWDDTSERWEAFDLVVVRATWDYVWRRDEFLEWAASLPRLANPADVLRWNTDKRYLTELHARGVPVVETHLLLPGEAFELPTAPFVVKPAVGAGSIDIGRYGPDDLSVAAAHVHRLHSDDRVVVVQPYRDQVEDNGETELIFLDNRYSHAIRKSPMLDGDQGTVLGLFRAEAIMGREPTDLERAVAQAALQEIPGGPHRLLYARVDVILGPGGPEVLELEVTEPSLFLQHHGAAADRFAMAIRDRLNATGANAV